jgi:hypothetical protein
MRLKENNHAIYVCRLSSPMILSGAIRVDTHHGCYISSEIVNGSALLAK